MIGPHKVNNAQPQHLPTIPHTLNDQQWIINNLLFWEEFGITFQHFDDLVVLVALEDVGGVVFVDFEVGVLAGVGLVVLGDGQAVHAGAFQVVHFGDVLQAEEQVLHDN